jgi:peptidoglycan/LPS O-acetylase OafA/YrhL
MYLWQEAIITWLDRPANWSGAALASGLSLLISATVYLAVEERAIALGRRIPRAHVVKQSTSSAQTLF